MGFIIISLFIFLTVSLFEYMDRTEWDELSNNVEAKLISNKNYGAYKIRNQHYALTVTIVIGILVAVLLTIGIRSGINAMNASSDPLNHEASQDSTQFAFKTEVEVETPPSQFQYEGNNGDNMPTAKDGGQQASDKPTNENNDRTPPPDKKRKTAESLEDFQKRLEDEMRGTDGQAARDKIKKDEEDWKKQYDKKNAKDKKVDGGNGGVHGTAGATKGDTDVEWFFPGDKRDAHQHNKGNVKVPGYTCGEGINATVVMKIKVNSNGEVISAELKSNTGGNQCCINQAKTYALKSRFEYSSKDIQEGTITYRFTYK